jgi:hypothetical protein
MGDYHTNPVGFPVLEGLSVEHNEPVDRRDSNKTFGPQGGSGPGRDITDKRNERRYRRLFKGGLLTSAAFMQTMRPPDYLVDGLLLRGATYTLTGKTGHCKTLTALMMAIKCARGDWFCGRKCKQGSIAFFAGENPDNVKMQWYSMCASMNVDPTSLPVYWYEGVFDLDEAREKLRQALRDIPDLCLCIFDSLQAFFMGDDDNQNMAMLATATAFREMSAGHPMRPVNLILAHPVKNATQDNLLPRGGSSLTNELDGNLTVWREENGIVTLHWLGKFRGVPFDPIKLQTELIKPEGLVDSDGNQMPCTVIRPLGEMREAEIVRQTNDRAIKMLVALQANPRATQAELGVAIGASRATAGRDLENLKKQKLIRTFSSGVKFTRAGEEALELAGYGSTEVPK